MPMFTALQALDDTFDDAEKAVVTRYLEGAAAAFETVAGPAAGRRRPRRRGRADDAGLVAQVGGHDLGVEVQQRHELAARLLMPPPTTNRSGEKSFSSVE